MATISDTIDAAIREAMIARKIVSKTKAKQVRGVDAIALLKATALAWFNKHRPILTSDNCDLDFAAVDTPYTTVLNST